MRPVLSFLAVTYALFTEGSPIISGVTAPKGLYVSLAAIHAQSGPAAPRQYTCGAVFIRNNIVMTAAHCVENPARYTVSAGRHDLSKTTKQENGADYDVVQWIPHPMYNPKTSLKNDIAIGIVRKISGTFEPKIADWEKNPASPRPGQGMSPVGWGLQNKQQIFGPEGQVLKMVAHKVVPITECAPPGPGETAKDLANMICLKGAPGSGPCIGDSGSPLYDSKGVVQGVVSHGADPCGTNVIYERVSHHANWIASVVNKK